MGEKEIIIEFGDFPYFIGGAIFLISAILFLMMVNSLKLLCPSYINGFVDKENHEIIGTCTYDKIDYNSIKLTCINSDEYIRNDSNSIFIFQTYNNITPNTTSGVNGKADTIIFDKKIR